MPLYNIYVLLDTRVFSKATVIRILGNTPVKDEKNNGIEWRTQLHIHVETWSMTNLIQVLHFSGYNTEYSINSIGTIISS